MAFQLLQQRRVSIMDKALLDLGWDEKYESEFSQLREDGYEPARVIAEHRGRYVVAGAAGELSAEVTGRFMHTAIVGSEYPKTGDWVAVTVYPAEQKALIHSVLARRSCFSRKAVGRDTIEQVLASNVDTIFIVQGLDNNYNPMRLLRYLTSLQNTGIKPVVVLNKADLNPDAEKIAKETAELVAPVPAFAISAKNNEHLEKIKEFMGPSRTSVFTGSSGVGKSTILNALAGRELAAVQEVRLDDSRGRHTTVARQLYILEGLGLIIDTPGIRELQLWATEDESDDPKFEIINEYAAKCKFRDCAHENEPGCAVKEAAGTGAIPEEILKSYFKLKKELEFVAAKVDENAAYLRKKKEKKFGKMVKNVIKSKKGKKGY